MGRKFVPQSTTRYSRLGSLRYEITRGISRLVFVPATTQPRRNEKKRSLVFAAVTENTARVATQVGCIHVLNLAGIHVPDSLSAQYALWPECIRSFANAGPGAA